MKYLKTEKKNILLPTTLLQKKLKRKIFYSIMYIYNIMMKLIILMSFSFLNLYYME